MPRAALSVCLLLLVLSVLTPSMQAPVQDRAWVHPALATQGDQPVRVIVSTERAPDPAMVETLSALGTVLDTYRVIDAALMEVPAGQVPALAALGPVWRVDPDEPLELHLDTSRPSVRVTPQLWEEGLNGGGTTVAVVDTGVDGNHPGLQGRVEASVVFLGGGRGPQETPMSVDADGHGTHVAGIVAGDGGGSTLLGTDTDRYAGMAVAASIVSLDISPSFTTSNAIGAFDWVHENHEDHGIKVVQNSWGRKEGGRPFDQDDPAVRASNALVRDDDLLLVFSAANQGPDPSTVSLEAQNPNVLTVGATDGRGRPAAFSSRGPVELVNGSRATWTKPDLVAPGVRITSASAAGSGDQAYRPLSGTSQAAPHVAGVAAILRSAKPDLGPFEIMEAMRTSARDLGETGPDPDTGHGLLDAQEALRIVMDARGGVLRLPSIETYDRQGRLVAGSSLGMDTNHTGVEVERAAGVVPVRNGTQWLHLRVEVEPVDPLPTPTLEVTLTGPGGTAYELALQGDSADRNLTGPAPGNWTWTIDASGRGAVDYHTTATAQVLRPVTLEEPLTGAGGFFNTPLESVRDRIAVWAQQVGAAGLAVFGALGLVLVGATVALATRRSRP